MSEYPSKHKTKYRKNTKRENFNLLRQQSSQGMYVGMYVCIMFLNK